MSTEAQRHRGNSENSVISPRLCASVVGFTLIELLVVIVIIAILTSLISIAVVRAIGAARISSTETFLADMNAAIKSYQVRWGDWPPSRFRDVGGRPRNDVNEGIETLVAALSSKKKGRPLFQPDEERYANTDEDMASSNVTNWFFGDNQLREYTDFLGQVLSYTHHREFGGRAGKQKLKLFPDSKGEVTVEPAKSEVTKTYRNPGRYQIRSVGEDGKPGTADDLWPAGN